MSNTACTEDVEIQLHHRYGVEDGQSGEYASCPPVRTGTTLAAAKAYREGFAEGRAEREAATKTKPKPGAFIQLSRAWYAEANLKDRSDSVVDDVLIGDYGSDQEGGNERGEFVIQWKDIHKDRRPPAPQLCMFDEAWGWLTDPAFTPFVEWLAENSNEAVTPADVCEKLTTLGWRDATPEARPSEARP